MATSINAAKRYKNIELPFECPLTNRKFDSIVGLSVYLTKSQKINHKEYYDKYINHREKSCFFCGNEGLFISVGKGYRNLCTSTECLKKSFVAHSVEGIMYREVITREEAELRFEEEKSKQLESRMKTFEIKRTIDKDWDKKRSRNSKLFWLEKGLTEEEAEAMAYECMKDIHIKTSLKKKSNPELYKDSYTTNKEYYLKKGFSEIESLELVSKRQATFSLEICIEKFGEIEGKLVWFERQEKWQKTLDLKSDEEKIEINRKKLFNNSGYSKISQEMFWKIYENFNRNNVKFEELNGEVIRYDKDNKKHYRYDYVDFTSKKVLEFNGDFWHCNPNKYNENFINTITNLKASDVWKHDEMKINWIKNRDYKVMVIWESQYKKDKEATIKKCINFLKEENV